MDASEIEAFLTLAEELHFGRTGERLRLSHSRVSRLISSLERRVGGPLFERTSRQVTLTPAGARLRDRVGRAWAELEDAFAEAQAAMRITGGTLRLGWPATVTGPALTRLAGTFGSRFPDCELYIHDVPMTRTYEPLRRGEIDVLAYWLVGLDPDLTAGPVIEYRDRVLAVGRGHRLAGRESVSVEELADEEVHEFPPGVPTAVWDVMIPPQTPSGRPIPRAHPWRSVEENTVRVASGRMVHPTVAGVPGFQRDDIRYVPIRDLPPMPLGLIWRTAHENAMIRSLAGVARRIGTGAPGATVLA